MVLALRGMISNFKPTLNKELTQVWKDFLLGNRKDIPRNTECLETIAKGKGASAMKSFFATTVNVDASPLKRFMDKCYEQNKRPDLKILFTDVEAFLETGLGMELYTHLAKLHSSTGKVRIALRRSAATEGCIAFHCDGGYATRTVQVCLNSDTEYEGGRLIFYAQGQCHVPERKTGYASIHDRDILHAVSRVTSGVRYSLFVVDKDNSLGDNVVRLEKEDVKDILATTPTEYNLKTLNGHSDLVYSVVIDGDRIVSGAGGDTGDSLLKIWNTHGECIKTLEGHRDWVKSVAIDRGRIVSGSYDRTIKIWNTHGECIKTLNGHSRRVLSVAIDGDRIVSGSGDKTIKIWNTEGECIKTLEGHSGAVYSVAIDGDRIVSGSYDRTIKIWNTEDGCIKTLEGHSGGVYSVAIYGDRIVSGSYDKTIKIWNTEDGCIKTLEGHSGFVRSVAIDGDRIVSGSEDRTIKIWNTHGECIKTLEGHSGAVLSVAIDGDRIVSGANCSVNMWSPVTLADAAEVEDVTDACLAEQEAENKHSAIDLTDEREATAKRPAERPAKRPAKRQRLGVDPIHKSWWQPEEVKRVLRRGEELKSQNVKRQTLYDGDQRTTTPSCHRGGHPLIQIAVMHAWKKHTLSRWDEKSLTELMQWPCLHPVRYLDLLHTAHILRSAKITDTSNKREALKFVLGLVARERLSPVFTDLNSRSVFYNKDLKHTLKCFGKTFSGNREQLVERLLTVLEE